MVDILIRNVSEAVHDSIKLEARVHGRSVQGQLKLMVERAALPDGRLKLGTMLARIAGEVGGLELRMLRDRRKKLVLPEPTVAAPDETQAEL